MFRPNDQLGPYTLMRKLGRGAFGEVWLAEERTSFGAHKVALKLPNEDDIDLEAIRHEAALWEEIKGHPNILPIIKADVIDGQVYLASEYASDGSLQQWLKAHGGRAPTLAQAVNLTQGILAGLGHLHSRRVIHRDLKPANILLQSETPRIADFGISRVLKTTMASANTAGTPVYMAPECFEGKRSERCDLWSVGVMFYQLATGHLPFPQADAISLINAILTREPDISPAVAPPGLVAFVRRALEKDPNRRFQSAAEMSAALRNLDLYATAPPVEAPTEILTPPITGIRPEPTQPAIGQAVTVAEVPAGTNASMPGATIFGAPSTPPPTTPDRRWLFGVGVGGLLLLVLAIVGIWYFTRSPSTTVVGGKSGSSSPLAPLVPDGVSINPPSEMTASDVDPTLFLDSAVVVTVPNGSGIYVNRAPVTLDQLSREVSRLVWGPGRSYFQQVAVTKPVYVLADIALTYGRFVAISTELRKPGVIRLALVGLRKGDGGAVGTLPLDLASPVSGFQSASSSVPDPLRLVVRIAADGRLTLNNEDQGTVVERWRLRAKLAEVFASRQPVRGFQTGTPATEKTVHIDADASVKYGDLIKIVDVIKDAGSDRIVSGSGFGTTATTGPSDDPNGSEVRPPTSVASPLGNNTNTGTDGVGPGAGPSPSGSDQVYRANEVTQPARITSKPPPTYTDAARQNNVQGTIRLIVVFTATGSVTNIRPLNHLDHGLTEQAIAAARRIQFVPARKDGRAVSTYATIEYNFSVY